MSQHKQITSKFSTKTRTTSPLLLTNCEINLLYLSSCSSVLRQDVLYVFGSGKKEGGFSLQHRLDVRDNRKDW